MSVCMHARAMACCVLSHAAGAALVSAAVLRARDGPEGGRGAAPDAAAAAAGALLRHVAPGAGSTRGHLAAAAGRRQGGHGESTTVKPSKKPRPLHEPHGSYTDAALRWLGFNNTSAGNTYSRLVSKRLCHVQAGLRSMKG